MHKVGWGSWVLSTLVCRINGGPTWRHRLSPPPPKSQANPQAHLYSHATGLPGALRAAVTVLSSLCLAVRNTTGPKRPPPLYSLQHPCVERSYWPRSLRWRLAIGRFPPSWPVAIGRLRGVTHPACPRSVAPDLALRGRGLPALPLIGRGRRCRGPIRSPRGGPGGTTPLAGKGGGLCIAFGRKDPAVHFHGYQRQMGAKC